MAASRCLIAILLAFVLSVPARAAEGWKMPNLNPFSKKEAKPKPRTRISDEPKSTWKMPKPSMPKPFAAKSTKKSKQPSTWQKMNNGTKNFFAKAKDTLNPFDDDDKPRENARTASKPAKAKGSSWMGKGQESEQTPMTPNDWLNMSRPSY